MKNLKEASIVNEETGEQFEIPEEGSLGLLALGYKGIMLWRARREAIYLERKNQKND